MHRPSRVFIPRKTRGIPCYTEYTEYNRAVLFRVGQSYLCRNKGQEVKDYQLEAFAFCVVTSMLINQFVPPTFCLSFAFTGVNFQGILHHVCDVPMTKTR